MDIDGMKMWACPKYDLSVLEKNAKAFCAKQFEMAQDKNNLSRRGGCASCKRGAMYFELGLHNEAVSRRGAEVAEKPETKGAETMATEFKKHCLDHGPFTATGPRGGCPKCKAAKPAKKKAAKKKIAKGNGKDLVPAPSGAIVAGGGNSQATDLAGSIDWSQYPKLHSRLLGLALGQVLAELETKA